MAVPLFNIGGLASGLDTAAIIDSLVAVAMIPVRQLESRKALFNARDNAWQDLNTKFSAVRTALDSLQTISDLNELVTAASSNEATVTVSATGSATPSTITFTVDALAFNHQLASTSTYASNDDLISAGIFTVTHDATSYDFVTDATTTVVELAQLINAEVDLGVSASLISIDGTNFKLLLTADETGTSSQFTTSGLSLGFDTVQTGQVAQVTFGSGSGGLVLTRSTNVVTDLIDGISIELHETSTDPVTVTVARDTEVHRGKGDRAHGRNQRRHHVAPGLHAIRRGHRDSRRTLGGLHCTPGALRPAFVPNRYRQPRCNVVRHRDLGRYRAHP